ncbi:MAG: hypothetical protein EA351_03500 [Gemmatimonadales bacterium]|nr:MAG: hypothetical protein EA351_03500 [Gemmatimonadales bacterium]
MQASQDTDLLAVLLLQSLDLSLGRGQRGDGTALEFFLLKDQIPDFALVARRRPLLENQVLAGVLEFTRL